MSGKAVTTNHQNHATDSSPWVEWRQGVLTTLIALFYTVLIVVSILVCVFSVLSIYKASQTPVTSTTILQQDSPYDPPVFILFTHEHDGKFPGCSCFYFNYSVSSQPIDCTTHVLKSTNARYLKYMLPEVYNKHKDTLQENELQFAYFRGPRYWAKSETLEINCTLSIRSEPNENKIEYLFLPDWNEFQQIDDSEKDIAIYSHLLKHPGMRFFPFGFENFVIISRTEIREAVEDAKPTIRLETETSLSLVDPEGFIGRSETNKTSVQVGVQWKDGYITDVRSFITATKWSAVSVISTMLLMLEKAYGFATRIYASVKSDREKKKIYRQNQQRLLSQRRTNGTLPEPVVLSEQSPKAEKKRKRKQAGLKQRNNGFGLGSKFSAKSAEQNIIGNSELENSVYFPSQNYSVRSADYSSFDRNDVFNNTRQSLQNLYNGDFYENRGEISRFDMMRVERNLSEINFILQNYHQNSNGRNVSNANGALGVHMSIDCTNGKVYSSLPPQEKS